MRGWSGRRRAEFLRCTGLQALDGLLTLLQLLVAARLLSGVLTQAQGGGSFRAVLPWVLASGAMVAESTALSGVQQDRQLILGELFRLQARVYRDHPVQAPGAPEPI